MRNQIENNITLVDGNLLKEPVEALVNTVNCVGVMGKGIARQFAYEFPENSQKYKKACNAGLLKPGQILVVELEQDVPRYIFNFATKDHWRGKSKIEWIEKGLAYLVNEIKARGIRSIAVPPLGCGNGGLEWSDVYPLMENAFNSIPHVQIRLFPPEGAPDSKSMAVGALPRLTLANALYLHLINIYNEWELVFSQIEIQKLAYFLQESGEPLRLQFTKGKYGPYAPNLRHVISRWEGHWMWGFGDGTGGPHSPMTLNTNAVYDADQYLQKHASQETWHRIERVVELINGFESAWSLELLATIHWLVKTQNLESLEQVIDSVQEWSPYKAEAFNQHCVEMAWEQLHKTGWL